MNGWKVANSRTKNFDIDPVERKLYASHVNKFKTYVLNDLADSLEDNVKEATLDTDSNVLTVTNNKNKQYKVKVSKVRFILPTKEGNLSVLEQPTLTITAKNEWHEFNFPTDKEMCMAALAGKKAAKTASSNDGRRVIYAGAPEDSSEYLRFVAFIKKIAAIYLKNVINELQKQGVLASVVGEGGHGVPLPDGTFESPSYYARTKDNWEHEITAKHLDEISYEPPEGATDEEIAESQEAELDETLEITVTSWDPAQPEATRTSKTFRVSKADFFGSMPELINHFANQEYIS